MDNLSVRAPAMKKVKKVNNKHSLTVKVCV